MLGNFDATNILVDLLNTYITPSPSLQRIQADDKATIKANADVLIARISQIQAIVEKQDQKLADKLDPELYRKLKDPNTKFKETISFAKKALLVTVGLMTAASVAIVVAIGKGAILASVVASVGVISACAIAGVLLGVLVLGFAAIAGAIVGAIERDRLEEAIGELENALRDFEPASREYTKNVIYVEVKMQIILE